MKLLEYEPTHSNEVKPIDNELHIIEQLSFLVIEGETNRLTDPLKQMLIHAIDVCTPYSKGDSSDAWSILKLALQ